jgi:redox-sensitive bicupin YhaK (pirin superfamily)
VKVLRRSNGRHHTRQRKRDVWCTFDATGEGALEMLDEERLPPGGTSRRCTHRDAEYLTYVREGALSYQDSTGDSGVINAGEFHCLAAGRQIRRQETNASRTEGAQVFIIGLRPSAVGLVPGREQHRFGVADRRYGLCLVASPDGRKGSLHLHLDASLYSAILDVGQHVVHELLPGRSAWLQLIQGEVTLGELVLTAGDGAGITGERSLSVTAREGSELLLLDTGSPS